MMHRMLCSSILVTLFVLCAFPLHADYIADRKAAAALKDAGTYTEALDAFTAMAAGEVSDLQKSDALTQASHCAAALKDFERAMELAKQVPLGPQSKRAQMYVLYAGRQFKQVVEQFGGEDLAAWPEHVAAGAYLTRGRSAAQAGAYELAAVDLATAVRFPMDTRTRAKALLLLGSTCKQLNREEDALAAFHRAHKLPDPYRAALAAMSIARIHTAHGEHEDAMRILDTIRFDLLQSATYVGWAFEAVGDALAGAGKIEAAIAKYEEAIAVENVPDRIVAACGKKIEALRVAGE